MESEVLSGGELSEYIVSDISLAEFGRKEIDIAETRCRD